MFWAFLAIVAISATTISWILDEMTADESIKHEMLAKDIKEAKQEIASLSKTHKDRLSSLYEQKSKEFKDRYLAEVRYNRKTKEAIANDLLKLKESISTELKRPDISPFLYKGLKREALLLEEAQNRLVAYNRYLAWYEGTLEAYFKNKRFREIIEFDIPSSLLPDEWLYVGKLITLDNKEELRKSNKFGQRIALSDVYFSETKTFDKEIEQQAFESYEADIPMLIVKEKNFFADTHANTKEFSGYSRLFWGSVLKGQLYINHLVTNMPFEVNPRNENIFRPENLYYYKNAVACSMKTNDKKFPLKRYHDTDEIFVYPIEYDLLLKKIIISEKPPQAQNVIISPVYIGFATNIDISEIANALEQSHDKINVTNYDIANRSIKLRISELNVDCTVEEYYLLIQDVKHVQLDTKVSIELPFQFEILPIELLLQNKSLLYDSKNSLLQMLSFIEIEFAYLSASSAEKNNYDFFAKWLKIVNHLIAKEELQYTEISYSDFYSPPTTKQDILTFEINPKYTDTERLLEIDKQIKTFQPRKMQVTNNDIKIAISMRLDQSSKFSIQPIGILHDDIDIAKKTINVLLDNALPKQVEFDQAKRLYIGFYRYPSALIRQKKALISFQRAEMVNQELKRMLISPNLIKKTVDVYEEEAFDKTIKWKNPSLTDNQKQIIKQALLEKNIFIIQGPPGTGKTTVIKEIVYQYLKDNHTRKCLIVSQQNTAVDNALLRIYKENKDKWFDSKAKSLIRIASDMSKVDAELQSFTIDEWFMNYKERVEEKYRRMLANNQSSHSVIQEFLDKALPWQQTQSDKTKRLLELIQRWYQLINKDSIADIDREVADVLINSHQIIGATCVGFANKRIGLDRVVFDLVIIDESARATIPELLIPILRAKKVILIGDQYQLPPSLGQSILDDIDKLDDITQEFLEQSYFEKIFEQTPQSNKAVLLEQFRMPKEVGTLISKLFYNGILQNGIEKNSDNFISPKAIQWIDVKGTNEKLSTSRFNRAEAIAIKKLIEDIAKRLPKNLSKDIAIITPYSEQKRLIQKNIHDLKDHIKLDRLDIKCNTVDSFQGQEADIVIYSCVRTDGNLSFLIDRKRLNVALSRVRENLFIVGHKEFLYNAEVDGKENLFKSIIDYIDSLT